MAHPRWYTTSRHGYTLRHHSRKKPTASCSRSSFTIIKSLKYLLRHLWHNYDALVSSDVTQMKPSIAVLTYFTDYRVSEGHRTVACSRISFLSVLKAFHRMNLPQPNHPLSPFWLLWHVPTNGTAGSLGTSTAGFKNPSHCFPLELDILVLHKDRLHLSAPSWTFGIFCCCYSHFQGCSSLIVIPLPGYIQAYTGQYFSQ